MEDAPDAPPAPAGRPLHQVGSRYAIRDYLRRMRREGDHATSVPEGWPNVAERMTRGRMPRDAVARIREAIATGPQCGDVLSIEEEEGAALGRPTTTLHVLRGGPVTARYEAGPHGDGRSYQEDWLLAQRETVEVRHDRVAFALSPYGVGFTRHMLERVYERESLATGGMDDAMPAMIRDLYGQIAWNVAKELTTDASPSAATAATAATTTSMRTRTAMPFGNGIAIVERRILVERETGETGDVIRATIRNGRTLVRETPQAEHNVTRVRTERGTAVARALWIATTYLSDAILRDEQRAFRDLHLATADAEEMRLHGRIMWDVTGKVAAMRNRSGADARAGRRERFVDAAPADDAIATLRAHVRRSVRTEPDVGVWGWA